MVPVRAAAARDLDRILRSGAYSNVVTSGANDVDERDHGLYQRLVYEALRHLPFIDDRLSSFSSRTLAAIDPVVLSVLRVAATEQVYLATADHAVAFEHVEAVRALGKDRATGFVNGVVRSLLRDPAHPSGSMGEAYPAEVIDAVGRSLGSGAEPFLAASNEPARIGLRWRDGTDPRSSPIGGAGYADGPMEAADLVRSGRADVIDPASTAVAVAASAEPGEIVADLAAAPGGKTRALADATGEHGMVIASDIHPRRIESAARRTNDMHQVTWLRADATDPCLKEASCDRVVLDAPCTGLGTMRRRPEIRFRFTAAAPARYGRMQRRMLEAAMKLARPGGRVVYSVCTVTAEETIDVVAGLGFRRPAGIRGADHGDGVLLGPHITGTDGMFIAVQDR